MGTNVQKGQRPLGAEHLATNDRRRGKMRTTIHRIMRDHKVTRGEAVDILNAERLRHSAEWAARDFDPVALERHEDRQVRRAVRTIESEGDRAARVAAYLAGLS